ncbi:hypothetical protein MMB17_07300 [Methylobacterium organophilum]|uniref:hypothetical protein n=1 Tax=Methylobacterium organophilum TaxID=410 RepID=UPI001F130EE4|nr:hypothetical protein [Methylobacterium organophilum]UMY19096.1 hypothetical protein MMB17_07300 [Methylobacterium organophilum]
MEGDDPRNELDKFSQALVDQLKIEIQLAVTHLVTANYEIARAQIEMLRQRTLRRLKTIDFEHGSWLARMSSDELPENDVLKVIRITIAVVEEAFDGALCTVAENEKSAFGEDGESDLPE